MISKIHYKTVDSFPGWDKAEIFLKRKIDEFSAKLILEVGSGANPTLSYDHIQKKNLEYTTNDTNLDELNKAPSAYKKLLLDFSSNEIPPQFHNNYDLIFSKMVNEHIKNGSAFNKFLELPHISSITSRLFIFEPSVDFEVISSEKYEKMSSASFRPAKIPFSFAIIFAFTFFIGTAMEETSKKGVSSSMKASNSFNIIGIT